MINSIHLLAKTQKWFWFVLGLTAVSRAATIDSLLDTLNAVQCYTIGKYVRCRNIRTSEDWGVFERDAATQNKRAGSINYDGTKLVCEDGPRNVVINLDGTRKRYISDFFSTNPGFYRDSAGDDWVIYTLDTPDTSVAKATWKVQIDPDSNTAIESTRQEVVAGRFNAGMSGNGLYLGDVDSAAFLYNVSSAAYSPALSDTPTASGSVHPFGEPRIMFSHGLLYHDILVAEWDETASVSRTIWRYHYDAGRAFAQWAVNNEDYCTVEKDNGRLYLVKLAVDTTGDSSNTGSYAEAYTGLSNLEQGSLMVGRPWVGAADLPAGTPLISPDGGRYFADSVQVTIHTRTAGAQVLYTLDSSLPTESSTEYTEPFYVTIPATGAVTVKARAFRLDLTTSPVATATFSMLVLRGPDLTSKDKLEKGLYFSYYEGESLDVGALPDSALRATQEVTEPGLFGYEQEENFALSYTGYFWAREQGKYTFYLSSDDSSEFFIGSDKVVASHWQYGFAKAETGLDTGYHEIRLTYAQWDGGKRLFLQMEGPGIEKNFISKDSWYRKRPAVRLLSPTGDEKMRLHDSLTISWEVDTSLISSVALDITIDDGITWQPIPGAASLPDSVSQMQWYIPDTLAGVWMVTRLARVRVRDVADSTLTDKCDTTFTIGDASYVKMPERYRTRPLAVMKYPRGARIVVAPHLDHRLVLTRPNGQSVQSALKRVRLNEYVVSMDSLASGIYVLRATVGNKSSVHRILIGQ